MTSAPWRNRISRYADVDPHTLTAHPLNARRHPQAQRDALTGLLDEVGLVQNVVLSERSGRILDGHARVEEALRTGQPTLPATYVDLSEAEEALVLASLDTITGLASYDTAAAAALYAQLETSSAALQTMLSQQAAKLGIIPRADPLPEWEGMPTFDQQDLQPVRQIIVSFASAEDVTAFAVLTGQHLTDKTKSMWYPPQAYRDNRELQYSSGQGDA